MFWNFKILEEEEVRRGSGSFVVIPLSSSKGAFWALYNFTVTLSVPGVTCSFFRNLDPQFLGDGACIPSTHV